jgi:hypothetical protein
VTKIFVANTYFLGFEALVSLVDVLFRVFMVVVWFEFFASGEGEKQGLRAGDASVWGVWAMRLASWIVGNAVHLWSTVKGF